MKPENNGRKLELKLAACKPLVDVFDVAVWIVLAGIFSSKLFPTVSFHTSTQTYHSTGSVLFLFLKLIPFSLKRHKPPAPLNKLPTFYTAARSGLSGSDSFPYVVGFLLCPLNVPYFPTKKAG